MSKPRLKRDGHGRLVLVTGCCPSPHGVVKGDALEMQSPHARPAHKLKLTPEVLRRLADEIEQAEGHKACRGTAPYDSLRA
jgi:hypothetical protein